jgi:hypothetical protein
LAGNDRMEINAVRATSSKRHRGANLAASALAAGATFSEAAASASVGERTLRRWWSEDEGFRRRVLDLQAEALSRVAAWLCDQSMGAAQ